MKIIILHGLYMHGMVMQPLSQKLKNLGYETQVITYNSVAINPHRLFSSIDHALSDHGRNILVGHSLGGLIIKQYLDSRKHSEECISHVVTLGSPMRGASIVTRIQDLGMGTILGNSPHFGLQEHSSRWDYPQKLGSIAGTVPIGARALFLMDKRKPSDGTVTVEETTIEGMTDHISTPSSHTSLIYSSFVPKQIDHFIHHDTFLHD
ncbi:esterase/lipase family protein [Vibrio nereis]|uniref:esterase/lipase family protein n=1 Tax=Vibrio nereis TaxID=693 RepID=UPI0024953931|nr:triacylglycerol lipase [Vibrio nereis]